MQLAIERLAVISFLIIGLSHALHPRAWVEFFLSIRQRGTAGCFINGFIHLPMGLLIVAFHNVWSGVPAVLTVLGWAWVIKGFVAFCVPAVAMRGLNLVSMEHPARFRWAGLVLIAFSAVLAPAALRVPP
jgi:hypothetical protein